MKRIYLEIYIWRIKNFNIGIYHSLCDAVDITLGFWTIVIFYKPEEKYVLQNYIKNSERIM